MRLADRVAVFGGTGLVGGHLVELLAHHHPDTRIRVPIRRPVDRWDARPSVEGVRVDFDALPQSVERWSAAVVFLCLGTTIRDAGSEAAFRRVDLEYTVEAARLAAASGARTALLVSSVGADADSSFFYPRIKGEAEAAVAALPFETVHLLRPSLLLGDRRETRLKETLAGWALRLLRPVLVGPLRKQRPIEARWVARAMMHLAEDPGSGRFVHEAPAIRELGRPPHGEDVAGRS